jgi:molybdopterin molybdotransferase
VIRLVETARRHDLSMPEPETPLVERPWEDVARMLSVDDALRIVLDAVHPLAPVVVPLLEAVGLVAAEPVVADQAIPPFTNSAMDGYAVRASDTLGASVPHPVRLRVVGQLAAGYASRVEISSGTAARIMTGAPLPDGADAVVRFEETDEPERAAAGTTGDTRRSCVGIVRAAKPYDNVRPPGEDVAPGDAIVRAGARLRPAEIGLLAAINRATVAVHPRPRVAILSTGDEVIDVGSRLQPGQIRNSNSYTLAAMVMRAGGIPVMLGIARDRTDDLTEKLNLARGADLIVTSGGVSLGDYDMVKDVLREQGTIQIWQVRMKPGKPLAFGRIGSTPLLGLPGNPVAAAVSFEVFGIPAMRRMMGHADLEPSTIEATLIERIDNRGQRRHFVRARVARSPGGEWQVATAGQQGAGVLSSLARANGLLVIPEDLEVAEPGMRLPVRMLD